MKTIQKICRQALTGVFFASLGVFSLSEIAAALPIHPTNSFISQATTAQETSPTQGTYVLPSGYQLVRGTVVTLSGDDNVRIRLNDDLGDASNLVTNNTNDFEAGSLRWFTISRADQLRTGMVHGSEVYLLMSGDRVVYVSEGQDEILTRYAYLQQPVVIARQEVVEPESVVETRPIQRVQQVQTSPAPAPAPAAAPEPEPVATPVRGLW